MPMILLLTVVVFKNVQKTFKNSVVTLLQQWHIFEHGNKYVDRKRKLPRKKEVE